MNWRALDETDRNKLQQLNERELTLVQYLSWWDGPLTGVAEYKEHPCWFQLAKEDGEHYLYILYPLSDIHQRQLEDYEARRQAWSEEWMPWDDEEGRLAAQKAWEVAGLGWTGPDLTGVQPLGWFMDGANQSFYGIEVEYGPRETPTEGTEADH